MAGKECLKDPLFYSAITDSIKIRKPEQMPRFHTNLPYLTPYLTASAINLFFMPILQKAHRPECR
jgi:hypothetical protein